MTDKEKECTIMGKKFLSILLVLSLVLAGFTAPVKGRAAQKASLNISVLDMAKGQKQQLKVTGASGKVKWKSSKKSVAAVTNKGRVTAKKTGTANITATVSGQKLTCKVTVRNKVSLKGKNLIIYFNAAENSNVSKEELDAVASASLTSYRGVKYGNSRVVAEMIKKYAGGELSAVKTKHKYAADYEGIRSYYVENEQDPATRPELTSTIKNLDEYDNIFVGFPMWHYTMPTPLYTMFDQYDFAGKNIIPFSTTYGSDVSSAVSAIRQLEPDAVVISGLTVDTNGREITNVSKTDKEVYQWLKRIKNQIK